MDNIKLIQTLAEAQGILWLANANNQCEWAEKRLQNAVKYLRQEQTALCEQEFPKQ